MFSYVGRHLLFFTITVLVSFGVSAGLWVLSIWYSVHNAPKEDMYYCPKHGPMRKQDTIKFMDAVEIVDKEDAQGRPVKSHISHGENYCPLCFSENLGGSLPR